MTITTPLDFPDLCALERKYGLEKIDYFLIPPSKYKKYFFKICHYQGKDPYEERQKENVLYYRGKKLIEGGIITVKAVLK